MPMGNGELGLSVKAEIRKKIKSRRVIMYMLFCTLMKSRRRFPKNCNCVCKTNLEHWNFSIHWLKTKRHNYVKWIYSAKTDRAKSSQDGQSD